MQVIFQDSCSRMICCQSYLFATFVCNLQDVVTLHNYHQMDQFLLEYVKHGVPPKRKGVRGDSDKSFDYHSEL